MDVETLTQLSARMVEQTLQDACLVAWIHGAEPLQALVDALKLVQAQAVHVVRGGIAVTGTCEPAEQHLCSARVALRGTTKATLDLDIRLHTL